MNARQFAEAMSELDDRYVAEALFYKRPYTSRASPKKLVLLIAAIVAVLALCGFTAHELGLFDRLFQKPSADPTQTVQSAIEGQADKVIRSVCASRRSTWTKAKPSVLSGCTPAASSPDQEAGRTNIYPSILSWFRQNTMWSTTIQKPFWTTVTRNSISIWFRTRKPKNGKLLTIPRQARAMSRKINLQQSAVTVFSVRVSFRSMPGLQNP